jgi:hypothetical protein
MKKISFVLMSLLLCLTPFIAIINAQQLLQIILYTNKTYYWLGDEVRVYGSLYFNSSLVSDGVVGLEIDDPTGYPLLFRTLSTGTLPSTEEVEIVSLFPSDEYGKPKNSFQRGYQAYFTTTVRNNNETTISFYVTLTCFDSNQGIMDSINWNYALSPHKNATFILPFLIPYDASIGTAIVYGNTFTKLPKLSGTALSIEKSATFTITGTIAALSQISSMFIQQQSGSFLTTFRVPIYQYNGTYTIYSTSRYRNQTATTIPKTIQLQVPDLNKDGKVDVLDLIIVAIKLGWEGTPGSIPADVNTDGTVDVLDLILVARALGWGE